MTANDIFRNSRLVHVRELKAEVARLNEELSRTRAERDSLQSHFDLALAAALDAAQLSADGKFAIIDGWNALLGSNNILTPAERRSDIKSKRNRLTDVVQQWLAGHPRNRAWIVFDGARADGYSEDRLRISFTGGTGAHRADRMICDYLRMCRLSGNAQKVIVFTDDTDFKKEAMSLGATVNPVGKLLGDR